MFPVSTFFHSHRIRFPELLVFLLSILLSIVMHGETRKAVIKSDKFVVLFLSSVSLWQQAEASQRERKEKWKRKMLRNWMAGKSFTGEWLAIRPGSGFNLLSLTSCLSREAFDTTGFWIREKRRFKHNQKPSKQHELNARFVINKYLHNNETFLFRCGGITAEKLQKESSSNKKEGSNLSLEGCFLSRQVIPPPSYSGCDYIIFHSLSKKRERKYSMEINDAVKCLLRMSDCYLSWRILPSASLELLQLHVSQGRLRCSCERNSELFFRYARFCFLILIGSCVLISTPSHSLQHP